MIFIGQIGAKLAAALFYSLFFVLKYYFSIFLINETEYIFLKYSDFTFLITLYFMDL